MRHLFIRSLGAASLSLIALSELGAQRFSRPAPGSFEIFAARSERSHSPLFGGLSLGAYSGAFGARLGGGVHFGGYGGEDDELSADQSRSRNFLGISAWTADADLVLEPLRDSRAGRDAFLGFSPYGFLGIGVYGTPRHTVTEGPLDEGTQLEEETYGGSRGTWSFGGGLHHSLFDVVGVEAEVRARRTLRGNEPLDGTLRRSTEYRLGLTFAFGGSSGRSHSHGRTVTRRPFTRPCSDDECGPSPVRSYDEETATRLAPRLLDDADDLLDVRYESGGQSPRTGFDAAGFVQYVFGKEGIRLPSRVPDQARAGRSVSTNTDALRPGDLLFFANYGYTPNHVAIYAGRDRIVHATASGNGVRYDVLGRGERGRWFADHLVSARRVIRDYDVRARFYRPPQRDDSDRPDRAPRP